MHLATRGKSTDGNDPAGRPISKTVPQTGVTGSFVDPTVPTPTIPYWTGKGHGAIPESSVPVYTVGLTQRYIDDHPRPFHRLVGPGSYLSPYDRRPRDEDLPVEDGRIVWPADYASNIDSLEYRTIGTVGYDRSLKGKTLCIFSYLVYDEMSGTRGFNLGLEPDNVSIRIINGCVVRFCSIAFVRGVSIADLSAAIPGIAECLHDSLKSVGAVRHLNRIEVDFAGQTNPFDVVSIAQLAEICAIHCFSPRMSAGAGNSSQGETSLFEFLGLEFAEARIYVAPFRFHDLRNTAARFIPGMMATIASVAPVWHPMEIHRPKPVFTFDADSKAILAEHVERNRIAHGAVVAIASAGAIIQTLEDDGSREFDFGGALVKGMFDQGRCWLWLADVLKALPMNLPLTQVVESLPKREIHPGRGDVAMWTRKRFHVRGRTPENAFWIDARAFGDVVALGGPENATSEMLIRWRGMRQMILDELVPGAVADHKWSVEAFDPRFDSTSFSIKAVSSGRTVPFVFDRELSQPLFSTADIALLTGESIRVIQLWIESAMSLYDREEVVRNIPFVRSHGRSDTKPYYTAEFVVHALDKAHWPLAKSLKKTIEAMSTQRSPLAFGSYKPVVVLLEAPK